MNQKTDYERVDIQFLVYHVPPTKVQEYFPEVKADKISIKGEISPKPRAPNFVSKLDYWQIFSEKHVAGTDFVQHLEWFIDFITTHQKNITKLMQNESADIRARIVIWAELSNSVSLPHSFMKLLGELQLNVDVEISEYTD